MFTPEQYIALYTSIVMASMMDKSRLMKEVANVVPTVYMCLGTNRVFYPHFTKVVVEWINVSVESMGYWHTSDQGWTGPVSGRPKSVPGGPGLKFAHSRARPDF